MEDLLTELLETAIDLEFLSEQFDNSTHLEYIETEYGSENYQEFLGDQIFDCYSTIGYLATKFQNEYGINIFGDVIQVSGPAW